MVTRETRGGERQGWGIKSYKPLSITNKIYKLQRYIVQHMEYSQYFIIMLCGAYTMIILNHNVLH